MHLNIQSQFFKLFFRLAWVKFVEDFAIYIYRIQLLNKSYNKQGTTDNGIYIYVYIIYKLCSHTIYTYNVYYIPYYCIVSVSYTHLDVYKRQKLGDLN